MAAQHQGNDTSGVPIRLVSNNKAFSLWKEFTRTVLGSIGTLTVRWTDLDDTCTQIKLSRAAASAERLRPVSS